MQIISLIDLIRSECAKTSQSAVARMVNVKPSFLSMVVKGEKLPSKKIAKFFGYQRKVIFEKIIED